MYGLQLYSIRDITENNLEEALKAVSVLGYKYIEFAGFFNHSADEINRMLRENNLIISGTHSFAQDLTPENIQETIKFHKAIGNPCYIIPGADLSTPEKLNQLIKLVNYAQPILAKEGISLAYHNHSFEYDLMPNGVSAFAMLEKNTRIDFELDTYWIYNAGVDPLEEMKRLRHRVSAIHIKDGFMGGEGVPLGRGTAPVKEVYYLAKELGYRIIVESETLTPDGLSEAKECISYLNSLEI